MRKADNDNAMNWKGVLTIITLLMVLAAIASLTLLQSNLSATADGPGSHLTHPDDPGYPTKWSLNNWGQIIEGQLGIIDADIDAPQAWEHTTDCRKKGVDDLIIAVLDTGCDLNHEDLEPNIWKNPNEVTGEGPPVDGRPGIAGIDDDGDGLIDEDSNGREPGDPEIPGDDLRPSWSPGGSLIAFASDRNGNWDIYTFPGSGGLISEIYQVTTHPFADFDPCWSPDGTEIAFASDRDGNWDIWTIDVTTKALTKITTNTAADLNPYWSPDGTKIAFASDRSGNWDIWTINVATSALTKVTTNTADDSNPCWSPDGTEIAFSSDRSGNWDIWTIPATGGAASQITTNAESDDLPDWSHNGSQIFFDSDRSGNWDIWAIDVATSALTQITTDLATDTGSSVMEFIGPGIPEMETPPPLVMVALSSDRSGNFNIHTIPATSEPATRITFTGAGSGWTNDLVNDDDENGYADDINGWDFCDNDNDPSDDDGHGTHVAGIIAAVGNNGKGVCGVCWRANLMILKIIDHTPLGAVVKAIRYAVDNGALILNNSWGRNASYGPIAEEKKAIKYADQKGAIFVASAGNAGLNNDVIDHYPSDYDVPNVIAVANSDNRDILGYKSNYGMNSVHLLAPGSDINSTIPGGYDIYSGTSMAAPHVSGAIAHFWTLFPNLNHLEVKDWILRPRQGIRRDRLDPRPDLQNTVISGINHDGRLRMISGDDHGDAPDPPYPTKLRYIGASHEDIGEEWLGWCETGDVTGEFDAGAEFPWDPDPDHRPNLWDSRVPPVPEPDYFPGVVPDLERYDDGLIFLSKFIPGRNATVAYSIRTAHEDIVDFEGGRYCNTTECENTSPLAMDKRIYVHIWVDWEADGSWAGNLVFYRAHDPMLEWNGAHCSGWQHATFPVPNIFDRDRETWLRIRLDYGEDMGAEDKYEQDPSLPPLGWMAMGHAQFGEVEDYPIRLGRGVPVFPNWYVMVAAVVAAGGLGYLIWRRLLKRA